MTCRGYDPKAVKVSKEVKRIAATILDKGLRRSHIKSYAAAEMSNTRMKTRGNREKSE